MASKNSIKTYSENTYYHIYNRGVEKRNIFNDEQDYSVFLSYLKTYLLPKDISALRTIISPKETTTRDKDHVIKLLQLKNYSTDIELFCYALLPNHFHFLLKQNSLVLNHFMNSLGTRYSMYFNRKYHRTGVLFQDVYKAVTIESDEQLLHLSRYIHLNPPRFLGTSINNWKNIQQPSSLPEYLGTRQTEWIKCSQILNYFSKTNPQNTYESFLGLSIDETPIAKLAIDFESD